MKVLITGSSGYLGSLLTGFLVSRNISVVGISFRISTEFAHDENFRFYPCDITNRDYLAGIFRQEQPTHVVHFASTFNKVRNRNRENAIDLGGSRNVLELSDATPSVRQLVYSSSAAAYGGHASNPEWIPESHPLKPGKYRYGMIKALTEEMLMSTPVREDLHVVVLRICSVTGPTYSSDRNVLNLLYNSPILPAICMNNRIQLLHQDDFLTLMHEILADNQIRGPFNMAPDSYVRIRDLAPDKMYVPIPEPFISAALSVLWHLRLVNLQPGAVNYGIYPIILDPSMLMNRYGYEFKYSTTQAYTEATFPNLQGSFQPEINLNRRSKNHFLDF